jgi:Kef-type K+ transport system membrane component KefB/nucleotide-binding universal stress UspA family protein
MLLSKPRPSLPAPCTGLRLGAFLALLGSACLFAMPAFAAEGQASVSPEAILLLQIVLLIFAGRLLGEIMQRLGQPSVMGQLLGGILLGPSVLGAPWPALEHMLFPPSGDQKAMIQAIAQFGIILLLLLTGMETDLKLVRRVGRAAISISLAGVAVPFIAGIVFGNLMPESLLPTPAHRLVSSLFLGTALAISSVKIVAMIVRDMHFMRRNIGQVIVASAVMEDTIGWIIIAITFSLARHGTVDVRSVAESLLGTGLFLLVSLTVGRIAVYKLIRWTNDYLLSEAAVISVILLITGTMALITYFIGVQAVLGAFVAGVLIGESPFLTKHIDQQLRGLILGFFAPVFFGMAGLSTDLSILANPDLLALTLGLIAVASLGKFGGAFLGAKIGGLGGREALALGCSMNARGSTEVIIATIGLSMGLLSHNLFTMIVATAVVTTLAMPPMLRAALRRLPTTDEERRRLEREEFEAKGFVANLERLLIAVDESANGRFASRLAGLLAGIRGIPASVLHLDSPASTARRPLDPDDGSAEAVVKDSADRTATVEEAELKMRPGKVEVTTLASHAATDAAVASEADKGYDLLVIGLDRPVGAEGDFRPEIEHAAAGFEGALAVVVGRGPHVEEPRNSAVGILLPVSGTAASRRAAEVAVTIARVSKTPITALYVASSPTEEARPWRRGWGAVSPTPPLEEAILKEVVDLADRYHIPVRTAIRTRIAPHLAITREAQKGGHDLVVMGVNRRPGGGLFFGKTATKTLARVKASVLLVAS